jgi:hypothetical protein
MVRTVVQCSHCSLETMLALRPLGDNVVLGNAGAEESRKLMSKGIHSSIHLLATAYAGELAFFLLSEFRLGEFRQRGIDHLDTYVSAAKDLPGWQVDGAQKLLNALREQ